MNKIKIIKCPICQELYHVGLYDNNYIHCIKIFGKGCDCVFDKKTGGILAYSVNEYICKVKENK
jgi:hypothetical protein